MSREFITKRITSLSLATFVYVVAFRLFLGVFAYLGLYASFLHVLVLGLTVSLPIALATYVFYAVETKITEKLKDDYFEDQHLNAQ